MAKNYKLITDDAGIHVISPIGESYQYHASTNKSFKLPLIPSDIILEYMKDRKNNNLLIVELTNGRVTVKDGYIQCHIQTTFYNVANKLFKYFE